MKTLFPNTNAGAVTRRDFISTLGKASAGAVALGALGARGGLTSSAVPSYLKNYAGLYASDPRRAALQWFLEARFGLFMHYGLYYSHGRDWRHPHAPNNDEWGGNARPAYDSPETAYATGKDHDLNKYLDFMRAQITELLTNYGPIAAIWLDGIATPASRKERLLELCDTLQPHGWGYIKADDGKYKTADEVMKMLAKARSLPANLLLNTGPMPDGSVRSDDVQTLREVGRRIREQGWPARTSPGPSEESTAKSKPGKKREAKK